MTVFEGVKRSLGFTLRTNLVRDERCCGLGQRLYHSCAACVLRAGLAQSLVDQRLNHAFGLPAHDGELADDQVTRSLNHPLFAKRKGLAER